MRIIAFFTILIGLSACVTVSKSSTSPSVKNPTVKPPEVSPSKVVSDYLEALKKNDFQKAYEFISAGYALNFDKEGYEMNMKHDLIEKHHWTLLSYQVLGAQVFGGQALVVAELEVKFKPDNSENETQKKISVQYSLDVLEKKWKIASSNCISNNCIKTEDFSGQGVKPLDLK